MVVAVWAMVASSAANAFQVEVKDQSGDGVANVAVALFPLGAKPEAGGANEQKITQKNKIFSPYVTIVQTGDTVQFPNKDETRHHVFSFSQAKRFELPLFLGASQSVTFDKVGIVPVGCNIHDWMLAYVVVADTPYHVVSNKDGIADFSDVPAGQYRADYWYPGMDESGDMQVLADSVAIGDAPMRLIVPKGAMTQRPDLPDFADEDY